MLFADVWDDAKTCPQQIRLVSGFSAFLQSQFVHSRRLEVVPKHRVSLSKGLSVTVVCRRPYPGKTDLDRMIENEDEVVNTIAQVLKNLIRGPVKVTAVDFSQLSYVEQVEAVAATDLLVGFHGAGMAHLLYLPENGAVLEFMNEARTWRCFQHMAMWRGLLYRSVVVGPPTKRAPEGKYTKVDSAKVRLALEELFEEWSA
jgi:capsular polysaccharide biosynthesis protein